MGTFRDDFEARLVDDRNPPRWRLLAPLTFESVDLGKLVIVPAGFETDLASVPRLPLAYLVAGDTFRRAATVHDYLLHAGYARAVADRVFLEAMRASYAPDDEPKRRVSDKLRSWAMFLAVRAYSLAAKK